MKKHWILVMCVAVFAISGCKKKVVPAVNQAPKAEAGQSITITLPTNSVNVSGSATDADGTVVSYLWSQVSGPGATTIANAGSANTTISGFAAGSYVFQLMVKDNHGAMGVDTLIIKVNPAANQAPKTDAGASIMITLPTNSVNVSGSATDVDGTVVGYLWSQVSGPGATSITNAGSASTAINGFVAGSYVFQLMATDNLGLIGVDTLSVTVNPNPIQTASLQPVNNPNERMIVVIGGQDQSFTGGNEWVIDAWTVGSSPYTGRKAFKFEFGTIPANATVVSANLYLYSNNPPENGNLINPNFGSNNALILQRITSAWTPSSVTWLNQPPTSTADQVIIPHTTQSVLDLNVDVTGMVSTMVNGANHGFLIKLQNEVAYTSRMFVSSYHAGKPDKHPKLVIVYK